MNASSVTEQVQQLSQAILDLLFPPRCAACHRVGTNLCPECLGSFVPLGNSVCQICSTPLPRPGLCERCAVQPPAFVGVRSAFRYDGAVRQAILALKYKRQRALASPLAAAMAHAIALPVDGAAVLCPVPMHRDRQAQRGYNHAELLAVHLAEVWHLPRLAPEALQRVKPTPRQVELDAAARQANLQDAFVAQCEAVQGRVVLLVDDVCTTGATLHACAEALLACGVASVWGITLARTP